MLPGFIICVAGTIVFAIAFTFLLYVRFVVGYVSNATDNDIRETRVSWAIMAAILGLGTVLVGASITNSYMVRVFA